MRIKDKRVLLLLRRHIQTGIMSEGLMTVREKGTPQGSPLSPLLSNIILDDLDKELECRGHSFCRYSDDCNVYVKSKRAGERVMSSLSEFIEKKLKLKVNQSKSAVDRPRKRVFLGYSFTLHKEPKIRVQHESIQRFKAKAKVLFRHRRGRNIGRFLEEDLSPLIRGWIRRRLRNILWRQWKRPRTRHKRLLKAGLSPERARKSAYNGRGPWWNSGASNMNTTFPKKYFDSLGLVSMRDQMFRFGYH